jgi:hypothetical protein
VLLDSKWFVGTGLYEELEDHMLKSLGSVPVDLNLNFGQLHGKNEIELMCEELVVKELVVGGFVVVMEFFVWWLWWLK